MQKIVLFLLFIFSVLSNLTAQWTKISTAANTRPTQLFEINGKIVVSDDYGLATSDDQGLHWQRTPTTNRLLRCHAVGDDLYAVTLDFNTFNNRAVIHSGDAGQTWDTLATGYLDAVQGMAKVGNAFYFLTGYGDYHYVQVLNIGTGQLTPIDTFSYFSTDLRFTYDLKSIGDKAFVATDWGLYRYSNGGSQIDKVYNEKVTMLSVRGDTLFSRTQYNFIYSLNLGQNWTVIPNDANFYPGFPVSFHFINNVSWLVSTDNFNSCGELSIWELNATLTDGTKKLSLKDGVCLRDFLVSSEGTSLLATDYYGITTRQAGAENWATNLTGLKDGNFAAYQQDDFLFAPGYGYISQDTGRTWFAPIKGSNYNYISSMVKKDGFYYVAFNYGGLTKSADLKNWEFLAGWVPHINKVGNYLVTATAWGTVQYSTDGLSWTNTNNTLQQAHFPPNQIQGGLIYALRNDPNSNNYTTLQTSADLAATWYSTGRDFLESDYESIENLAVLGPNAYLQTSNTQSPGKKVYVSHNFGYNWDAVPLPTSVLNYTNSIACSNDLFFVTDAQRIWVTANDGETWTELDKDTITGDYLSMNVAFGKLWVSSSEGTWARNLNEIPLEIYKGSVFHDQNSNGLRDNGEPGIPNVIIKVSNRDWQVATDSLGNYEIRAELVNDSIRASKPIAYCTIVPSVIAANIGHLNSNDFAVQTPPAITDVSVTAINAQVFRPGFETEMFVSLRNEGTQALDSIQLVLPNFDDLSPIEWLGAEPPPSLVMGDTLIWNNLNIDLFGQKDIKIRFRTFPTANWWETVSLQFTASKTNDANIADNVFAFFEPLFGSYDPNDKRVEPDTVPPAQLTATDLNYTIRFQNTGNYPADFVTILDTLPTALDIATLKVLAASHDFRWQIIDGRVLQFKFDPIFLPDSISNEPASHGFVQFSIRAKGDLPLGSVINNRAAIYFDYNPPVITDFSKMYVENVVVGTKDVFTEKNIQIRPNPANDVVYFEKTFETAGKLAVFAADGRLVWEQKTFGKLISVQIRDLPKGLYFVKWNTDTGSLGGKFVKE